MCKTRWLAAFVLPFLLVSFLQSQSLADLAKKEKERRAALKGKPATVITTATHSAMSAEIFFSSSAETEL